MGLHIGYKCKCQQNLDYLDDTPRYPKRDRDEQRMQTVSS